MQVKHYLFDADGTVIDSMEIWAAGITRIMTDAGLSVPDEFVETCAAMGGILIALHRKRS